MARKDKQLEMLNTPAVDTTPSDPKKVNSNKKAPKKGKPNGQKRKISIGKFFREMISELKKVEWAPFRKTKNNPGVLNQTGTVLIVVAFFMIIISLFDLGLTELLDLLLSAANA